MAFVELSGYFDDSHTHPEAEAAVCAGYIATVTQWKQLERNWKEADADDHFWPLHTTDLLAGFEQFKGWDEPKKQRVLRRLIGIANARVRRGFISGVVKRDYDGLVPDWLKVRTGGSHYTFCVWSAFAQVADWRKQYRIKEPIQYIFDQMGKGKGEIMAVFDSFIKWGNEGVIGAYPRTDNEGGLSFQSKKNLAQLQAADIIASAAGWHLNHKTIKGRATSAEPWFQDVMSVRPGPMNRYFDRENIPEFVERMGKWRDDPNWGVDP